MGIAVVLLAVEVWYSQRVDLNAWLELHERLATIAGGFALLAAAVRYVASRAEMRDAERRASHYRAWQTINSAQGKPGNCGRYDAVQELAQDGVDLSGINLDGAWLRGIQLRAATRFIGASLRPIGDIAVNLQGARMNGADFSTAWLDRVNLSQAQLERATFSFARLSQACLADGHLEVSNFFHADLREADFLRADLRDVTFRGARMEGTNFRGAQLQRADLQDVQLRGVALDGANLEGAHLANIEWDDTTTIAGANISGVVSAPDGFCAWAAARGAIRNGPISQLSVLPGQEEATGGTGGARGRQATDEAAAAKLAADARGAPG